MSKEKLCNSARRLKNKCNFNKKLNENEVITSTFDDDFIKQEIIISGILNDATKDEIMIDSTEINNSVNSEIIFNITDSISDDFSPYVNENVSISFNNCDEENISEDKKFNTSTSAIVVIPDPPSFIGESMASKEKERIILSNDPLTEMKDILSLEESSSNVVCSSYTSFQEKIMNFEMDSNTKYVILKTRGTFTSNDELVLPKRIHWWTGGNLHGVPYFVIATRYLSCRFGTPTHAKVIEKYKKDREKRHERGLCKRYKNVQGTRKLGCPVKIVARRLLIFPDLKGYIDSPNNRTELKRILNQSFKEDRYENRYTCILPDIEDHMFHPIDEKEPMDKRILQRIKMLVNMGKTNPDDIAEDLEDYSQMELNEKDTNRRRFYPSRLDIQYTVNRARSKIRCTGNEQERIISRKQVWGDESELFIRPMEINEEAHGSSKFLLVYQNREMKRLFRRYGNNAVFVDAVHRTCEHIWPLYFLVVNTSINYQVVGMFITQHEGKQIIKEALEIIKSWNPEVTPKYGLVNRPWEEAKGLELAFADIQIFISSYHRIKAWKKKIARRENNGIDRAEILEKLNAVADAATEEQIKTAISNMKGCKSYNSSSAKYYYESTWHSHLRRWGTAYWPNDLLFEMNNGIHRLEKDLNYEYLTHIKCENLFEIIDLLIMKFIPKSLLFYKHESLKSYSNHSLRSQHYFRGYASWVVDYLLGLHYEASQISNQNVVETPEEKRYLVVSGDKITEHEVGIVPFTNLVTCSCLGLNRANFICKHIISVGLKFPELHISKIHSWLLQDPIFHIDDIFLEEKIEEPDECEHSEELNHLQSKCISELRSLESMLILCNDIHLKDLYSKLKVLKENHSKLLRLDSQIIKEEVSDWRMEDE